MRIMQNKLRFICFIRFLLLHLQMWKQKIIKPMKQSVNILHLTTLRLKFVGGSVKVCC